MTPPKPEVEKTPLAGTELQLEPEELEDEEAGTVLVEVAAWRRSMGSRG